MPAYATANVDTDTVRVLCPPCMHCGKRAELLVPAEPYYRWQQGELIQNALSMLSVDDRELLISGFHPECWTAVFGEEE